VVDWNRLPQYVVDAPSTNALKNRLDKYWRNDMGIKASASPLIIIHVTKNKQVMI